MFIVTSSLLTTHLNFKLHSRLKLIKSNLSYLLRDFLVLIKVSFKTLEALMWPRVALVTCDDVPAMWVFPPRAHVMGVGTSSDIIESLIIHLSR